MFRPLSVEDTLEIFSPYDPAIDWDAMTEAERTNLAHAIGMADGSAWAMAKFKPGEVPTKFKLGVIRPDAMARIEDKKPGEQERRHLYFVESLIDVDWPDKVMNGDRVDRAWVEKVFIRELRPVALSMGAVAYAFNTVSETERKNFLGRLKQESDSIAHPVQNAPISSEGSADAASQVAA